MADGVVLYCVEDLRNDKQIIYHHLERLTEAEDIAVRMMERKLFDWQRSERESDEMAIFEYTKRNAKGVKRVYVRIHKGIRKCDNCNELAITSLSGGRFCDRHYGEFIGAI